jgi:hypothetical protein
VWWLLWLWLLLWLLLQLALLLCERERDIDRYCAHVQFVARHALVLLQVKHVKGKRDAVEKGRSRTHDGKGEHKLEKGERPELEHVKDGIHARGEQRVFVQIDAKVRAVVVSAATDARRRRAGLMTRYVCRCTRIPTRTVGRRARPAVIVAIAVIAVITSVARRKESVRFGHHAPERRLRQQPIGLARAKHDVQPLELGFGELGQLRERGPLALTDETTTRGL